MQFSLKELIEWHTANKQSLQVQDIYKMLYQSIYGPSHLLANLIRAEENLKTEYRAIIASGDEQMIEPISLDGSIIRVNLRPYKAYEGNIDLLFEVLRKSASQVKGDEAAFIALWQELTLLVEKGKLQFDISEVKKFSQELRERGAHVKHHSGEYLAANKPTYRVVVAEIYYDSITLGL